MFAVPVENEITLPLISSALVCCKPEFLKPQVQLFRRYRGYYITGVYEYFRLTVLSNAGGGREGGREGAFATNWIFVSNELSLMCKSVVFPSLQKRPFRMDSLRSSCVISESANLFVALTRSVCESKPELYQI